MATRVKPPDWSALKKLTLFGLVVADAEIFDRGKRSDGMARSRRVENVKHLDSPRLGRIGDECPVTAPGNRLCAHDGGGGFGCVHHQTVERSFEFGRFHVIRVSAEPRVPPLHVTGIGPALSAPAKLGKMRVANRGGGK